MDLEDRLLNRLGKPPEEVRSIMNIVDKYNIKPTIRNFDQYGFLLRDKRKRTVRISHGKYRYKNIHIQDPKADIVIVFADDMLIGWIESGKLQDIEDRMLVDVKAINPMPPDLDFKKLCPHLEVHGGFLEDGYWTCAGCGLRLVSYE